MGLMDGIATAAQLGIGMIDKQQDEQIQTRRDERQSDLALIRAEAVAKLQQRIAREEEERKLSPEYLDKVGEADKYKATKAIDTQRGLIGASTALKQEEFAAGAPLRQQQRTEELDSWKHKFQVQTQAELEATVSKLNDPKYLAGKAKEARATHIDDGAPLRSVQLEAAKLALDEKRAEAKMPPAVKELASSYREQLKSLSAVIDKGTLEGNTTPDGIQALETKRAALSKKLTDTLSPYMGDKVKTDAEVIKQDVTVAGKVIGQASTREEGAAMVKEWQSKQSGNTGEPTKRSGLIGEAKTPVETPMEAAYNKSGRAQKDAEADKAKDSQKETRRKADADKDIVALRAKLSESKRSGDPRDANKITQQIQDLMSSRYGL